MDYSSPASAFLLRGNRTDESAWRGALALQGATWVADADPFGGFALDTSTGMATLPANPIVRDLKNQDWTLEALVKPMTNPPNGGFIASVGVASNPGYASIAAFLTAGGNVGLLASSNGASWVNVSSYLGAVVPNGIWSFLEFTRLGSTLIAAVNGVDVLSYGIAGALNPLWPGDIFLGGNPLSGYGDRLFPGLLGPMRFTQGVALRGAGGPLPVPTENFPPLPPLSVRAPERPRIAAASPVPPHNADSIARLRLARDVEFGGTGRLYGTTKIETSPAVRVPTKARVSIMRDRDKLLAREVWSDPVTGEWEAAGLDTRQDFVALAQDAAGNFQPVAADKTMPEEMS